MLLKKYTKMEKKLSKKKWHRILISATVLLFSCTNDASKKEVATDVVKINAILLEEEIHFNVKADTSNFKVFDFKFINNPYNFNDSDSIGVYLEEQCIHSDVFKMVSQIKVSNALLDREVLPGLVIKSKGKAYSFINKKTLFIGKEDSDLNVVFCPTNEVIDASYMFTQKK